MDIFKSLSLCFDCLMKLYSLECTAPLCRPAPPSSLTTSRKMKEDGRGSAETAGKSSPAVNNNSSSRKALTSSDYDRRRSCSGMSSDAGARRTSKWNADGEAKVASGAGSRTGSGVINVDDAMPTPTLTTPRRDARYRKLQTRVYNFLERPRGFRAVSYHVVV